jgi:hypothetical protein
MQHSPSWEANSPSESQENPRLVWNPKVHYRVGKNLPLVPSPVNHYPSSYPISLRSILKLSSHLRLGFTSCLFPYVFPTKILYAFLISPMRATCPTPPILLDLITLIIFGEEPV